MGFKIVRDGQREYCEARGVSGTWRTSPDPVSALTKKIGEEYGEFVENRDPEELYDLLDVIGRLLELVDPKLDAFNKHYDKVALVGKFRDLIEWHPHPSLEEESR